MLNVMNARGPRVLLMMLAAGLMLSVSGCSSWHRKPKTETPPVVTQPNLNPDTPPDVPKQRTDVVTNEEFGPETGVRDVHFDYDKADLRKDQLAVLDKNLDYFKSHGDVKIMIEGHCDERGTEEYNYALGQRRAAAVQDYLMKNGIAADRLHTLSKGKSAPLDVVHTESAWAKNRRDHFMKVTTR